MLRDLETRSNLKDHVNENIKESIKFLHLVLKVQNYCNWVLIIVFPLMPLSLTAYIYFTSNDIVLLLPFYAVYPFDAYSINYWPIILIKQIWTVILTVLYVFGADALYYICCTFIHVQFKLLQQEIQGSIPESLPYDGREGFGREVDEALTLKIAKLVTWHQDIIKAVGLVEKINSKTTLFNFLCSSFLICLTGFTVTEIDGMYVVSFVTFLGICFFQIFFLCLFGDLIEQSSAEVSNAVYESKWNLTSIQHSKELYIIMMRAQKSCKLTAYGFAEVNLTAFTKIMNTAMSYFTLLKTLYSSYLFNLTPFVVTDLSIFNTSAVVTFPKSKEAEARHGALARTDKVRDFMTESKHTGEDAN
ncbi:odorant receptor 4-like [Hyposmocoma kahamanoa]|uniref:odorant receptor 4-like n=1 Tax=Hyposmocoma kahamanoa TaxID=1477025 RepID=UPI000E6DA105|nr:odorant receptor 4-like [Hyposmocoma kahamanoa]